MLCKKRRGNSIRNIKVWRTEHYHLFHFTYLLCIGVQCTADDLKTRLKGCKHAKIGILNNNFD